MENTRRFERFPTQREAQYFLVRGKGKGQECTIIDVSRKGLGMIFHSNEEISVGTNIRLEIPDPITLDTIDIRGELRWSNKIGGEFIGGIELAMILSDVKYSKLA
ncbi:MAG: PilZ domain-containing protein [Deltaproteobacteria bacterium]|nr:PilZ domain-containing protein [Deltaproteobacteria bacterium]